MLILSEAQLASMSLDPITLVDALDAAFRRGPEDSISGLKAQTPGIDGGVFQALPAVLASEKRAALKWISVASNSHAGPRIRTSTLLSDAASGETLALLSSVGLTAIRTAAMSALAARYLRPDFSASSDLTIGLIGCGVQAHSHLHVFRRLYPGIHSVVAYSPRSSARFAESARELGFNARRETDPDKLIRDADIVISTVPPSEGKTSPYLDPARLNRHAFASFVDLGRPWLAPADNADLEVFTDYIPQSVALVEQGKMMPTRRFSGDLYSLAQGIRPHSGDSAAIFVFGGLGVCDAVIAQLAYQQALAGGMGTHVDFD